MFAIIVGLRMDHGVCRKANGDKAVQEGSTRKGDVLGTD